MANILVVEDEKPISDLIAINLGMTGHRCAQAYCGRDAVALARDSAFDLMLLDIMLPDIDGFGVLERVRDIPAIFLTARHETTDKVRGFTLGADDYITKPFEVTELLLRVQAVLRRTKKRRPFTARATSPSILTPSKCSFAASLWTSRCKNLTCCRYSLKTGILR